MLKSIVLALTATVAVNGAAVPAPAHDLVRRDGPLDLTQLKSSDIPQNCQGKCHEWMWELDNRGLCASAHRGAAGCGDDKSVSLRTMCESRNKMKVCGFCIAGSEQNQAMVSTMQQLNQACANMYRSPGSSDDSLPSGMPFLSSSSSSSNSGSDSNSNSNSASSTSSSEESKSSSDAATSSSTSDSAASTSSSDSAATGSSSDATSSPATNAAPSTSSAPAPNQSSNAAAGAQGANGSSGASALTVSAAAIVGGFAAALLY